MENEKLTTHDKSCTHNFRIAEIFHVLGGTF